MDPIIVSIVAVVIGWFAAALVYTFDQGRRQGKHDERLAAIAEQVKKDREAFRLELREFRAMFQDNHGNPRLMSVPAHHDWCNQSQKVCAERFSNIIAGISKDATDRLQRDNEVFSRLRKIEKTLTAVATKMQIKEDDE